MRTSSHALRPIVCSLTVVVSAVLAGCGGGQGAAPVAANVNAGPRPEADSMASMMMSCPDGPGWQCSGETILRLENGIGLTASGLQAYGRSTNDLLPVNPWPGRARGMAPASGGLAEMRIRKDADAVTSSPALLLSKLGLSWDGVNDRPPIVETFMTEAGRVELDDRRALVFKPLPPHDDLSFYDQASKGSQGTQQHYANNAYFPRDYPARCVDMPVCPSVETRGASSRRGNWRTGGIEPDVLIVSRLHEDGDAFAGDGPPGPDGKPTRITTSSGHGVAFPGAKGYRALDNWSLRYANLTTWVTQDTVNILEWGGKSELNAGRRGMLAFGDTTDPRLVPASGSATYTGLVQGAYAENGSDDPRMFRARVTVKVDFASRRVDVSVADPIVWDDTLAPLPLALNASLLIGSVGQARANYMTGQALTGPLSGGISARFFGPVTEEGSGAGPADLAGLISISNAAGGKFALAGFIASKR